MSKALSILSKRIDHSEKKDDRFLLITIWAIYFKKNTLDVFRKTRFCLEVKIPSNLHTFQPPSSSKRNICNKPSISRRWHHGCQNFGF